MDAIATCVKIAARQHGAIHREQAIRSGVRSNAIDRLLRSGAWVRLHPSVYALWVPEHRRLQRFMAGTLWLGRGSAASHRAAVDLLELDVYDRSPFEFVTIGRRRSPDGTLLVHRVSYLPRSDIVFRANIPVTSPTRTLIDLGAVAALQEIELALEAALRRGLTSARSLRQRLARLPIRAKHVRVLRDLLGGYAAVPTESALETLVWRLFADGGLELPERQFEVLDPQGRFVARVDFAYPHEKVAIEADGYRFHSALEDWTRDRSRQNALAALGWVVYRVTWVDATQRQQAVVSGVSQLLDQRRVLPVPADT